MYRSLETYRGFVYPTAIDQIGHMNVASYTSRFDEATWHFLAQLGLTPSFLREHGHGAVAADQHTKYLREVLPGSLLHIQTELQGLGRSSIRFIHRMYDSEGDAVVATTELVGVYFDMERRTSAELPAFVRERANALRMDAALDDMPVRDLR
jgi:acyl-CoA thioester hydrolase